MLQNYLLFELHRVKSCVLKMYKNILLSSILIISAVSAQSTADTAQKNPIDNNNNPQYNSNVEVKEVIYAFLDLKCQ
jgi:hypothetical protein